MSDQENSDNPTHFLEISKSYYAAFDIIWDAEFSTKHWFYWDKDLILGPISQLLGVALETACKGLLVCAGEKSPKTHDLDKLFSKLDDDTLKVGLDDVLRAVTVPRSLIESNKGKPLCEVTRIYRTPSFHIHALNRVYDRPFVSRYPVLDVHSCPYPDALRRLLPVIHERLDSLRRHRRLSR